MPWMGRHRGVPRHPVRFVNLLLAGILVFIGTPAMAISSSTVKLQRLERACLSDEARIFSSPERLLNQPEISPCRHFVPVSIHDFVDTFLSAAGVVRPYLKTQIGFEPERTLLHPVRHVRQSAPRGPPINDLS